MTAPRPEGMSEDSRGLSIDMLDADRLRSWAEHFNIYGANGTHWASVSFMVEHLRGLAGRLEEAVRDIGSLRADGATLRERVEVALTADVLAELVRRMDAYFRKRTQPTERDRSVEESRSYLMAVLFPASAPKEPTP